MKYAVTVVFEVVSVQTRDYHEHTVRGFVSRALKILTRDLSLFMPAGVVIEVANVISAVPEPEREQ